MDKNNKSHFEADKAAENVNGALTSDSFNTYSKLQNPKLKFNIKIVLLYTVLTSLLLASAYIFASTIKTAYFAQPNETEKNTDNINIIRSTYQNNDSLKVETVTEELSQLFGIPVGVKIVELDSENAVFNGLKINDIITAVSGNDVANIEDMNAAVEKLNGEPFITYTVYRNGVYKTIDPYND